MLHELQLWVGDFFCTSLYDVAYNGLFYIQYQIISSLINSTIFGHNDF